MNDWRKPCPDGYYSEHWGNVRDPESGEWSESGEYCPGGSPITVADLEGIGYRQITFCVTHDREGFTDDDCWESSIPKSRGRCNRETMLLIPIPTPSSV